MNMMIIVVLCLITANLSGAAPPRRRKTGWPGWLWSPAGCLVLPVHNRCCAQESLPSPNALPRVGRLHGGA
jgi:hypothetical protein